MSDTGNNKSKGLVWLSIGAMFIAIGILCMAFCIDSFALFIISIIGIAIGSIFLVLGVILFFVGNKERRMKINSIAFFWIGLIAIIVAALCFMSAYGGDIGWNIILFWIIAPIGVLFIFIGLILFSVWKRESKITSNLDQVKNPRL